MCPSIRSVVVVCLVLAVLCQSVPSRRRPVSVRPVVRDVGRLVVALGPSFHRTQSVRLLSVRSSGSVRPSAVDVV